MAARPLISQNAYLVTVGTFFALAITVAIARITIRVYKFRRVHADDYFLFLALATLICSNALFFVSVPELYLFASASTGQIPLPENLFQTATDTAVAAVTAEILAWITIFAVKFSFLFYFRNLVQRLPMLTIWWRLVLAICIPVAITSMCGAFIVCPYVGSQILSHCVTQPEFLHRERVVLYYSVISDIVTDALIISIPIYLLCQTHLQIRQKINIGILLCLSLFMIAIAMVRGIAAQVYGTHDQIWASFWVQLETSVSVTMVSTMIFKTLFVVKDATINKKFSRSRTRPWRKQTPQLPDIETGATMTGMRTLIRENDGELFDKDESQLTVDSGYGRSNNDNSTLADGDQAESAPSKPRMTYQAG